MGMSLSKLQETVKTRKPGVLRATGSQRAGHDLATEQQHRVMVGTEEIHPYKGLVRVSWNGIKFQ